MKMSISLSAHKPAFYVRNEFGEIRADWKTDLLDEEDEDYLPSNCTRILELQTIKASAPNMGYGTKLMTAFLASPSAKKADMIFLDPVPIKGEITDARIKKLMKFYAKFGFKHNPKSQRMWLTKQPIPESELPG